jgi:hypothetical protein
MYYEEADLKKKRRKNVCIDCYPYDEMDCMFCCDKCIELFGKCPDPLCHEMTHAERTMITPSTDSAIE